MKNYVAYGGGPSAPDKRAMLKSTAEEAFGFCLARRATQNASSHGDFQPPTPQTWRQSPNSSGVIRDGAMSP